jgi:PilZ domain/SPOR domain
MTAPITRPERRQNPRTTVNRLAYINLESNNGAIVLNVSDGGLCFHAAAPIQRNETIRFWFLEHNHRIEADGKLAWIDETQKTGGLRFRSLSTEARQHIFDWINQPVTPLADSRRSAQSPSLPSRLTAFNAIRLNRNAVGDRSAPLEARSRSIKAPALLRGFSGGLALGIVVSALVGAAFLLRAHHRELGSSLIRLGERLGAKYQPQTMSPAPNTMTPTPEVTPLSEKVTVQPLSRSVRPQQAKVASAPTSAPHAPTVSASATTGVDPVISSRPTPRPLPTTSIEADTGHFDVGHVSDKVGTVPEVASASRPIGHAEDSGEEDTRSLSTKFLEIGKFHDVAWANNTTGKLTQLGFHTIVIHRGHLWTTSYQVLVGPYPNEAEAEAAHENLVSRGFRPRSYERGSRNLTFISALTVDGTRMPFGDFVISWESYVPDAIVKFEKQGRVLGTAEGKWVRRGIKYEDDAVVYRKNSDGSRILLEIRFTGMSQALVF